MNKEKYGERSTGLGLSMLESNHQSSEEDLFRRFVPVPIEECLSEIMEDEKLKPDSFKQKVCHHLRKNIEHFQKYWLDNLKE